MNKQIGKSKQTAASKQKVKHLLQREFRVEGLTLEDVCRYMGIKRTNANRTKSKYREEEEVHLD